MLLTFSIFLLVCVGIAGAVCVFHDVMESLKEFREPEVQQTAKKPGAVGAPVVHPDLTRRMPVNHGPGRFR